APALNGASMPPLRGRAASRPASKPTSRCSAVISASTASPSAICSSLVRRCGRRACLPCRSRSQATPPATSLRRSDDGREQGQDVLHRRSCVCLRTLELGNGEIEALQLVALSLVVEKGIVQRV